MFEKATKQEEEGSRLRHLSALLTGVNRAFPYLRDKEALLKHIDALFRLVHDSSFATSTQALTLISHIAFGGERSHVSAAPTKAVKKAKQSREGDNKGSEEASVVDQKEDGATGSLLDRFYRALYNQLLSDQVCTRTRNTLFLNLLYRSMKYDPSERRTLAFLKRIVICSTQCPPQIAAGLIFMCAEVCKSKKFLIRMLIRSDVVEGTNIGEDKYDGNSNDYKGKSRETAVMNKSKTGENGLPHSSDTAAATGDSFGVYDGTKREPLFAVTGAAPALWELALMRHHFHPSVRAFSRSFLEPPHEVLFHGDPTTEFSLTSFLNRFAYKNPKKLNESKKSHRPMPAPEEPVNNPDFILSDLSEVAPDKAFFHKFFGARERLLLEGKSRNR